MIAECFEDTVEENFLEGDDFSKFSSSHSMPERIPNILTCSFRNVCVSYPGVVADVQSLNKSLKQEAIMDNAEILNSYVSMFFPLSLILFLDTFSRLFYGNSDFHVKLFSHESGELGESNKIWLLSFPFYESPSSMIN